MKVTLDLSPMLVNRTAVYDICLEVDRIARGLPEMVVDYQFVGRRFEAIPVSLVQRELRRSFFDRLGDLAAFEAASGNPVFEAREPQPRVFYLDPLYVLFAILQRGDLVMCHDLSPLTHPHWHNEHVSRLYGLAFSRIVRSRCDVVTVSRNTEDTFKANFGSASNFVRTLHLYVPKTVAKAAAAGVAPPSEHERYFLFVGSLEERKNISGAIRAFALSGLAAQGYRLLVAGGHAHGAEAVERLADQTEGVTLLGFVSETEKLSLYAGATGFVYPSYLEGFGLPLLEAMSFGVPCVATVAGASPEVGGPDVPCLDPDDHLGIARRLIAIASMEAHERDGVGMRLRERAAKEFSYDKFARGVEVMLRG